MFCESSTSRCFVKAPSIKIIHHDVLLFRVHLIMISMTAVIMDVNSKIALPVIDYSISGLH